MKNIKRNIVKLIAATASALLVNLAFVSVSMAAPLSKDLGALYGDYSVATGINNKGQVIGQTGTSTSDGVAHAFIFENGKMTDLGVLGGNRSEAKGINDNGQVIGESASHGFVWENGKMTDLGTLGGNSSSVAKINGSGQVIGQSDTADGSQHAFIWINGEMTDMGTLGGTWSTAKDINEKGQVIGESKNASGETHGFIWEDGKITDLGTLGGSNSSVNKINEKGQIIGDSDTEDGNQHGFIWEKGKMTDLGTLGGTKSWTTGINNKGQVIGYSYIDGDQEFFPDSKFFHGFIWDDGKMTDLGTLGQPFTKAEGINDNGEVVGVSLDSNYSLHGFLWKNEKMTDLCEEQSIRYGYITEIVGINNKGQVFGDLRQEAGEFVKSFMWENGKMDFNGITNIAYFNCFNENGQAAGRMVYEYMDQNNSLYGISHALLWKAKPDYSITPSEVEFDPSNPADITVRLGEDVRLVSYINVGANILYSTNYSVSGSLVTINKSYLSSFFNSSNPPDQKLDLTFVFDTGDSSVLTITRTPTITLGDLNNDGKINSTDASILIRILLGTYTDTYDAVNADMNRDTKINSTDCSLLKRKILASW
ncbi:MAG TPA: dockerin type I domain-containing protein [Clostridia bacterium]